MTQKEIREYMAKSIRREHMSHAFILEGDRGSDWKLLAEDFAAMIQCEEKNHCGKCHSCQAFEGGNHPDIIHVTHEKRDSIGVDEIRQQLVDDILIKPYSSPYKVYLVDEAEKMTVQAQNALLKTMEEPPYYGVVILMTSNVDQLLPTIRSRCTILKTQSLNPDRNRLEEEIRDLILRILHEVMRRSVSELAEDARQVKEYKPEPADVIDLIRVWFRDLLVYKSVGGKGKLMLPAEENWYRDRSEQYSYAKLDAIFREIDTAESRIRSNVNFELALELMFMAMKNEPEKRD